MASDRQLYEEMRALGETLGMKGRELDVFAAGRDGPPQREGFDGVVDSFKAMGLTDAGARAAAIGRDGTEYAAREAWGTGRSGREARESAATMTRRGARDVSEAGGRVVAAEAAGRGPGRLLVQLIKAGWSLNSRYYPAEVLKRDGPRAFPKGMQNFVDHQSDAEEGERPAGSLRNLASYQTESARWDEARQGLVAEVRVFEPWREAVTDWARSGVLGMSIRAWVYGEEGTAEGRSGFIVTEFDAGRSVDYVTVPAAGGQMLNVLETR